MRAIEILRHRLALVVRVDDHFTATPWPHELVVELDSGEPLVVVQGGGRSRHADGTYRFVDLVPGPKQLTVSSRDGTSFSWSPSFPLMIPLPDPTDPVVVEMWPTPSARIASGTLVIRARLMTAPAGQEVGIEVVGLAPRGRRTRCDANGELVFVVAGPTQLNASYQVELAVTVPGRTVGSIQILDGDGDPVVAGSTFAVPPGRETRALFNLI